MHSSRGAYSRKSRGHDPRNILTNTEVAALQREALHKTYGASRAAAKDAADDAASSPRAAENWLQGENPMGLTAFLNAYQSNPTFRAWARKLLLMERDIDPEFEAESARYVRACLKHGQRRDVN